MLNNIFLAFIPIFVAVDALGVMPIYLSLTEGLNKKKKIEVIFHSAITAMCLAIAFIFLGKAVFKLLSITIGDFMIAGGALLFCIAIIDIIDPTKKRKHIPANELGAVPLGTPLIVGPAVLATSLIIIAEYGLAATLISVFINVLLAALVFYFSGILIRLFGVAGARALSKVTSLLLAAIAVMLIRKGVFSLLAQ